MSTHSSLASGEASLAQDGYSYRDNVEERIVKEESFSDPEGVAVPTDRRGSGSGSDEPAETESSAAEVVLRFFTLKNFKIAMVPLICGTINGYTIGIVGVYTQVHTDGTNCAKYRSPIACESAPFAQCAWKTDGPPALPQYCGWYTHTCRVMYPNQALGGSDAEAARGCVADSQCVWSHLNTECSNAVGYSTAFTGIFAGSVVLGSMFGALIASSLITRMGTKLSFIISGAVCVVCSVMCHVDAAEDTFWIMNAARFVMGFFTGFITVASPLYVNQNAAKAHLRILGSIFQIATTFGVLLNAIIGLGVGQSVDFEANSNPHIMGRLQALCSGQTVVSLALLVMGVLTPESRVRFNLKAAVTATATALNDREFSYRQMMPQLLASVLMCITFRFTGFNAILNFGPTLMGGLGLAPLVGNLIVMIVNFIGTILSIPFLMRFSARILFLIGSCFISCMCLFLCGVAVYPGVTTVRVTNIVGVMGIVLYIFVYEVLVGPAFYIITQDLFPPSFRPKGNSIAQCWQFIFNLVINVCYSIAVTEFSGGPEANQHKGQAIIYMFFGGLGLACFVLQCFFMHSWESKVNQKEKKLKKAEAKKGEEVEEVTEVVPIEHKDGPHDAHHTPKS